MVGWSYEAYKNVSENKGNWEYIYPEEGMHCYVDNYCICKTTDNVDLCNKLINYIFGADFNKVVWKEKIPEPVSLPRSLLLHWIWMN